MNRALSISANHPALAWWLGLGVLAATFAIAPPLAEPEVVRGYADTRDVAGVPHFWNVVSNLPLLLLGAWGAVVVARSNTFTSAEKWPYGLFFGAVALAGIGSTYFHLAPTPDRLMWDRLPIALAFMALLAGIISDRVSASAGTRALPPLVVAGVASVLYWRWSALYGVENILPYALVQYGGLAAIVMLVVMRPGRYTRSADLLTGAGIYAAAKIVEMLDVPIYASGALVSGHMLKHLLVALAVWPVLRMVQLRRAV